MPVFGSCAGFASQSSDVCTTLARPQHGEDVAAVLDATWREICLSSDDLLVLERIAVTVILLETLSPGDLDVA
jgi:hypothetical protein